MIVPTRLLSTIQMNAEEIERARNNRALLLHSCCNSSIQASRAFALKPLGGGKSGSPYVRLFRFKHYVSADHGHYTMRLEDVHFGNFHDVGR